MKLEIRCATPQDLEPMLEWRGGSEAMKTALAAEFAAQPLGERTILIAFDALQNQIGTVQLVRNYHDPDLSNVTSVYLQGLDVRDTYRGRGVGTALIRALESHAKSLGFSRVTLMVDLDNAPALALYKKLGFQWFKQTFDVWDGQTYPVDCFEKIWTARRRLTPANRLEKRASGAGRDVFVNSRRWR